MWLGKYFEICLKNQGSHLSRILEDHPRKPLCLSIEDAFSSKSLDSLSWLCDGWSESRLILFLSRSG